MSVNRRRDKVIGVYKEAGKMEIPLYLTPDNRFSANILGYRMEAGDVIAIKNLVKEAIAGFSIDYHKVIEYFVCEPAEAGNGVGLSLRRFYLGVVTLSGYDSQIVCEINWDRCEKDTNNPARLEMAIVYQNDIPLPLSLPHIFPPISDGSVFLLLEYDQDKWELLESIQASLCLLYGRLSKMADLDKIRKALGSLK